MIIILSYIFESEISYHANLRVIFILARSIYINANVISYLVKIVVDYKYPKLPTVTLRVARIPYTQNQGHPSPKNKEISENEEGGYTKKL